MKGNVHARMRRRRVILVSPFCKYFTRNLKKKKNAFIREKTTKNFHFPILFFRTIRQMTRDT